MNDEEREQLQLNAQTMLQHIAVRCLQIVQVFLPGFRAGIVLWDPENHDASWAAVDGEINDAIIALRLRRDKGPADRHVVLSEEAFGAGDPPEGARSS